MAALARLELSPQEEERIAGELEAILGDVDKLNELDVTTWSRRLTRSTSAPPFARTRYGTSRRSTRKLLEIAPDRWQGFFRVPKIIE